MKLWFIRFKTEKKYDYYTTDTKLGKFCFSINTLLTIYFLD